MALTNAQFKRMGNLLKTESIQTISEMISETIDCDKCCLKSRCPVIIEYNEYEETGWYKEPINSCHETILSYIFDGNIRDLRVSNKQ